MEYPLPWSVTWTNFGESMGYDSRSRVVDAVGKTVAEIGNGCLGQVAAAEDVAARIVRAINAEGKN